VDEIKRVFSTVFTRDVRSVEPTKTGLIVGENVRVYKAGDGYELAFLVGTDNGTRSSYIEKLDQANVKYKVATDFTNT
jgi:hypothetical protein